MSSRHRVSACAAIVALAALYSDRTWAHTLPSMGQSPDPVLGSPAEGSWADPAITPAYRVLEDVTDGLFNFMRAQVVSAVLPERLARGLKAAPEADSALLFNRRFGENEARYLARAQAAYPVSGSLRSANAAEVRRWSSWAAQEQLHVAVESFKDTAIERYQLELFGHSSGTYAKDRRNWDPGFVTMAGLLGGAFLYLNGLHASVDVGPARIGLDLAAGLKYRQVLQGDGTGHRLANVELGLKHTPLSVAAEWGILAGHLRQERVGVSYRLRF